MYCETPEENALLEKLMSANPDSDRLTMNLVAWMWINQREKYEEAIALLQRDYVNPEDIPLVSNTDEEYRKIYPDEIKAIPSPALSQCLEE
jgi:hypothetical protein